MGWGDEVNVRIRSGMFETNSSSTHCLVLSPTGSLMTPEEARRELGAVGGVIHVTTGEYGWDYKVFTSAAAKASYCATWAKLYGNESDVARVKEAIASHTGCLVEIVERSDSYIDNQSADRARDICALGDRLSRFIFCRESALITDNDNRPYDATTLDNPEDLLYDVRALASYRNGNTFTAIFPNGTKVRLNRGVPRPEFPESIDLKITDRCDGGCPYCHESSNRRGAHADRQAVYKMLDGLPPGVEIAVGGGDPLEHPEIRGILADIAGRGLIGNLTINGKHLFRYSAEIKRLLGKGLTRAVGVTYDPCLMTPEGQRIMASLRGSLNVHFILGVHTFDQAKDLLGKGNTRRIVLLGFKNAGRAKRKRTPVENINEWRDNLRLSWLPAYVGVDNLAMEQLGVRSLVTRMELDLHYMGDDGDFSMYVDAVAMKYAKNSISDRIHMGDKTVVECFGEIRRGL